ncbi:MAG: SIMPL domain-containing protein [Pseudomonadota bacterium]
MNFNKLPYLILVISILVFPITFSYANGGGIEVSGTAKVSVIPDIAKFSFSINDRGKLLVELKANVDKKTVALVSLCKKLGIKTKDISSSEVSITPQYNYQTKTFIGYEVYRNIKVTLNDLIKYPDLVNGAITSGITMIRSIELDTKDRSKLEIKALGSAIEEAKKKAEILAKSTGVTLGKVIYVKEGDIPIEYGTYKFKEKASGSTIAQQGAFEPGEISVSVTVFVKYDIY